MNRFLLACCVFVIVTSQFSAAVILRPKWFPYFRRENQGGSGRSSGSASHSSRPSETLTSRQARTVGIVDTGANRGYPFYRVSNNNNNNNHHHKHNDNDNNSGIKGGRFYSSLSPRCPVSLSSEECLGKVLTMVNQMLRVEGDFRATAVRDAYDV